MGYSSGRPHWVPQETVGVDVVYVLNVLKIVDLYKIFTFETISNTKECSLRSTTWLFFSNLFTDQTFFLFGDC